MANKYDPRRPHNPDEKFSSERASAIRAAAESARQMEMRSFTSGGMNVQRNTRSNIQARFANQMNLADAIERDERKSFGAPGIRATRLATEERQRIASRAAGDERRAVRADNKLPYDERRGFVGPPSSLASPQQPTTSTTSPQSTPVTPETAREFSPFPRQQTIADFSNRVLEEARKRHPLNAIAAPAAPPAAPRAQAPIAAPPAALVPPGPRQETPLPRASDPDPVGELLPEPERPYRFPHREFAQPTVAEPQDALPYSEPPTDPAELEAHAEAIFGSNPEFKALYLGTDHEGRKLIERQLQDKKFESGSAPIGGNMDPAAVAEAKAIPMHPWASPEGEGPFARAVSATAKQISDPLNAILDPIFGMGAPLGPPLPADLSVRNLEQADTQEEFERERLLASRQELQNAFIGLAAGGRTAPSRLRVGSLPDGYTPPNRGLRLPAPTQPSPSRGLRLPSPTTASPSNHTVGKTPSAPAPVVDPLTTLAAESAKAQQASEPSLPRSVAPPTAPPGFTFEYGPTDPRAVADAKPVDPRLRGKEIVIESPASAPTTQATKTVKPPVDPVEALVPPETPQRFPGFPGVQPSNQAQADHWTKLREEHPRGPTKLETRTLPEGVPAAEPTPPAPGPRAPFTPQQQLTATRQLGSGFPIRVTDLLKSGFTAAELQAEVAAGRMKLRGQGEAQLIQLTQQPLKATRKVTPPAPAPVKAPDALDTLATEAKTPNPKKKISDEPRRGIPPDDTTKVMEVAAKWDSENRGKQRDWWFGGGKADNDAAWAESLKNGGHNLLAHGMVKNPNLELATKELLGLLEKGLDPNRGGGQLYSAPLVVSNSDPARQTSMTSGGNAYNDGPYILVARPGQEFNGKLEGLGAILVNSANPEIIDSLRKAVHAIRPDIRVESFENAGGVTKELVRGTGEEGSSVAFAKRPLSRNQQEKLEGADLGSELLTHTQALKNMKNPAEKLAHLEREGVLVKMGDSLVVDHSERLIVLARINGVEIPFYLSTGMAGKDKTGVPSGHWYPIFGVTKEGWIIKGQTKDIISNYGSPKLAQFKEFLDANFKDLPEGQMARSTVPGIEGERIAWKNHGLSEQTRTGMINPLIDYPGYLKANQVGTQALMNLNKGVAKDFIPGSGKPLTDFIKSVVDRIEGRGTGEVGQR